MINLVFFLTLLSHWALSFQFDARSAILSTKSIFTASNLGDQIKYSGKGFNASLQSILSQSIFDSSVFFKDKPYSQTDYISGKLKQGKPGDWNIIIVPNLNISKITEVTTTFFYWSQNDTWAFWYSSSPYSNYTLHIAIYNGNESKQTINLSTNSSSKGSNVTSDDQDVIVSVVSTLPTVSQMGKYLQKFFQQKWNIISIPVQWGGKKPEAYANLSVGNNYLSLSKNVVLGGKPYSQLLFV